MTLEPEPGRDLDPVANRWAGNTVGFEYSGFRVKKYLGGDRCPECGRPMVWAGMGWEPHPVSYHAWWREFLLTYLARMLKETRKVNQAGSWLRLESE